MVGGGPHMFIASFIQDKQVYAKTSFAQALVGRSAWYVEETIITTEVGVDL